MRSPRQAAAASRPARGCPAVDATGRAGRRGLLIAGGVTLLVAVGRRGDVVRSRRHDARRATRARHGRRHDVGIGDRPGDLSRRQVRRVHVGHARQLSYSCSTDRRRALRGRERLDQRRARATQLVARRIADRIRREQRRRTRFPRRAARRNCSWKRRTAPITDVVWSPDGTRTRVLPTRKGFS